MELAQDFTVKTEWLWERCWFIVSCLYNRVYFRVVFTKWRGRQRDGRCDMFSKGGNGSISVGITPLRHCKLLIQGTSDLCRKRVSWWVCPTVSPSSCGSFSLFPLSFLRYFIFNKTKGLFVGFNKTALRCRLPGVSSILRLTLLLGPDGKPHTIKERWKGDLWGRLHCDENRTTLCPHCGVMWVYCMKLQWFKYIFYKSSLATLSVAFVSCFFSMEATLNIISK